MIRAKPILLGVAGLLVLAAVGWLLHENIEVYEETEESRWSREALRNPYLAAQQYLERSGIAVVEVDNLSRLGEMASLGTLFFSDAGQVQTPRQHDQVMQWLRDGGNVIYTAYSFDDDEDLLLASLEVEVEWYVGETGEIAEEEKPFSETLREYNRQLEAGRSREEIAGADESGETSLTRVGFGDAIGDLEIAFDTGRILRQPYVEDQDYDSASYRPFSWSRSDAGIHMMQFEIGDGLLTIVTDPGIWTSYRIDQHDHAYLLSLLASETGEFAMLQAVLRDSIWALLRRNAAELLIATLALVLFWIWHQGRRFGRLLPTESARRRALGEYFSSVSHYLWYRREGSYLIAPLRQEVLRRASFELAGFATAAPGRQFELLAKRAEVNPRAVTQAFEREQFNESTFVQTVRLLKRIEQSL